MLKIFTVILLLLWGSVAGMTQFFQDFGQPNATEMRMTECSFDPDAGAMVLVKEAVSNYNDQYNLITEYRIRIKILKESGLSYADVEIPFYHENDFEFIDNIDALVYNLNGQVPQIEKLDRKNIFRRKLNERWSKVSFSMPGVRVGSVIEYKYTSRQKNYNGLEDWNFQERIPVRKSFYRLTILPNAEFSYLVHKDERFPIEISTDKSSGSISYQMNNIPALTDEPYMDARRDYLQRVTFQLTGYTSFNSKIKYMSSWKEVNRQIMLEPAFGGQLRKNLNGTDAFIKLAKLIQDPEERMRRVLSFTRSGIKWDGSVGKYANNIKNAWNEQKGSAAEVNFCLINLLQEAGLQAYPLLVAERSYGKVIPEAPFVDQFNKVIAYVVMEGRKFYLDATDNLTPVHIVPAQILNTYALVVDRSIGELIRVTDDKRQFRESVSVDAEIMPDMTIKGRVRHLSYDYARVNRFAAYKRNESGYARETYGGDDANLVIDSFEINNLESDTLALNQILQFRKPMEGSGDYFFLPISMFTGFEANPFIAKQRMSHVNFGYQRRASVTVRIKWPKDYVLDEIPKSLRVQSPDKSIVFSRDVFTDLPARTILTRLTFNIASFYPAEHYDELRDFYKKMFELLKEQAVIKKS